MTKGLNELSKSVHENEVNKKKSPQKKGMMAFRYQIEKKDFLVKAYGKKLPEIFRSYSDRLIIEAIEDELVRSRNIKL